MTATPERRMLGIPVWRWEAISYMIAALGALGVVFGVYQYYQQVEANRARETLAMIEMWETRGYRENFVELRQDMLDYWATVPSADIEFARTNANAAANLREAFFGSVINASGEKSKRFERIVYFYNRLGLCIQANLCSAGTARIFFADPLNSFLSNFEPRLEAERKVLPGYASGVLLLKDALR